MSNDNSREWRAKKNVRKSEPADLFDPNEVSVSNDDTPHEDPPEASGPVPAPTAPTNPFDPAALRLGPNAAAGAIGVKRQILSVRCDKPNKQEFVRVRDDEAFRLETAILIDNVHRESYLVAPPLWSELPDFITLVRLSTAITRHGNLFLWQAKLPAPDGRPNDWHDSMLQAQELATKRWVRVQADMAAGSYAVFEAVGNLPEPEWPDLSFPEILKLAFQTRFIDTMNHPILQQLNGVV